MQFLHNIKIFVAFTVVGIALSACGSNQPGGSRSAATVDANSNRQQTQAITATPVFIPSTATSASGSEIINKPIQATQAPTLSATPSFLEWVQSNPPNADALQKSITIYAQVAGITAESIRTRVLTLQGPNGIFAVTIDQATNAPLMIAVPGSKGAPYWQEANRKNLVEAAGLRMGTSVTEAYTESWSPESKTIITILGKEGNQYVIDYEFIWYNQAYPENSLRPGTQTFNFKMLDAAVKFAHQNDLKLEGQYLMPGNPGFIPPWLKSMDRNGIMDSLHTHIDTIMKRYPQIDTWCVVGELENQWGANFWGEKLGITDLSKITPEQLVPLKQAYDWAREANPNAKLYYSEGGGFEFGGGKADRTFNLIKMLKDMKAPIDGIAFQMHLTARDLADDTARAAKMKALTEQITRYKSIGINVIAPEMDLNMHGIDGSEAQRMQLQAKIEKDVMKTLLQAGVTNISFFGGNDKLNWMQDPNRGGGDDAHATIFDMNGARKPSYYADEEAIIEFLQGK